MIIKQKLPQDRFLDAQSSRNELVQSANRCVTSLKEFSAEFPRFERELEYLRDAAEKGAFTETGTGFPVTDELADFSERTRYFLQQFAAAEALIEQLRPRLKRLAK